MMKWLLLVAAVVYARADSIENWILESLGSRETTCECGWANRDGQTRIVGGSFYQPNEYPFIAGIALIGDGEYIPACGGSIITPNHVLTAAHCTDKQNTRNPEIVVLLGNHDRSRPSPNDVVIKVASIQQHPGYRKDTRTRIVSNDISLLTLASSINFNGIIGPVCLPLRGLDVTGQTVRIIGWGAESFEFGTPSPMTLQPKKVDVRVIKHAQCASGWGGFSKSLPSSRTKICTIANKEGACKGDSGGPVVWLDPQTNRYTLVGVASMVPTDCTHERPSINTRVEAYLPWIKQQIAATKPSDFCVKDNLELWLER